MCRQDSPAGGEAGVETITPFSYQRTLHYFPIVHTPGDMGALGESLQRVKAAHFGRRSLQSSAERVEKLWQAIAPRVESIEVEAGRTRVYQDGLPVCGHEEQIAAELAQAGSINHRLLLRLRDRGAVLMGTESPELLLKEYQLVTESLHPHPAAERQRMESLAASLLRQRDAFIAERINTTLQNRETGILFLGMLHNVQAHLRPDIRILYPIQALLADHGAVLHRR